MTLILIEFLVESSEYIMDKNTFSQQNSFIIIVLVTIILILSLSVGFLVARSSMTTIYPTVVYSKIPSESIPSNTFTPVPSPTFTVTPALKATNVVVINTSSTIQLELPQSYTATPRSIDLAITNETATEQARKKIPNNVLMNPTITFSENNMKIVGTIFILNSAEVVEIEGMPRINNGRLVMSITSAKINGQDLPTPLVAEIEKYVNNVLSGFFRGLLVQSFELGEGTLELLAVEQK